MAILSKYFLLFSNSNEWEYPKGQLISEWIYKVTVSPRIQTKNFCPHYTGQKSWQFLFVFWEKWWLHKFILKLSDLWVALPHNVAKFLNCCLFFDGSALPFLSFFQFFQNYQFLFKCPISKIWTFLIFQTSYSDPPWPSELFIILMKNQMQNSSTFLKKLSPPCSPHCA